MPGEFHSNDGQANLGRFASTFCAMCSVYFFAPGLTRAPIVLESHCGRRTGHRQRPSPAHQPARGTPPPADRWARVRQEGGPLPNTALSGCTGRSGDAGTRPSLKGSEVSIGFRCFRRGRLSLRLDFVVSGKAVGVFDWISVFPAKRSKVSIVFHCFRQRGFSFRLDFVVSQNTA